MRARRGAGACAAGCVPPVACCVPLPVRVPWSRGAPPSPACALSVLTPAACSRARRSRPPQPGAGAGGARAAAAMRVAASALVLIAAVATLAAGGGGGGSQQRAALLAGGGGGQSLDWSAFDQQLHSDWVKRAQAHKKGMSSAQMALQERKEEDERRMLAQKRLEVKKVAEEKEMEQLERNIELEASNQLAAHNTQLSDAIVQSAPQLQPQVVFQGHFQPGYDAQSPGEAAAELAAWGPGSNADWARVLAQQRKESQLAGYQPSVNYNPIPQQRAAALRTGPGSTGGDALHTAWVAENQLRAAAKTEDLANVKAAAMNAADHSGSTQGQPALTLMLSKWLQKSKGAVQKMESAKKAPVPAGHVAMSAALAGRALPAAAPAAAAPAHSPAAEVKELSLEAKLAHEQAQNAILKEKLKEEQLKEAEAALSANSQPAQKPVIETPAAAAAAVGGAVKEDKVVASAVEAATLQKAAKVPIVHAKSAQEQSKWAAVMKREQQQRQMPALTVSGPMRCCDDSCETIASKCNAPSPVPSQPAVTFGVHSAAQLAKKAKASTTQAAEKHGVSGGAGGSVPKDASEKQLVQFLISGTPAQKHEAAGLLYHETEHHEADAKDNRGKKNAAAVGAAVQKHQELVAPVKEVLIKGIRRCCDSSCNYVNTVCPNTHQLDQHAVKMYAAGEGPSQSQLSNWLVSGTQVQKDEAAAVFFAINHGVVAKEKKQLDKKKAAIAASSAPPAPAQTQTQQVQSSGVGHPDALEGSGNTGSLAQGVAASHGHSESAKQAGQVVSEAENIVGDLAAEGH